MARSLKNYFSKWFNRNRDPAIWLEPPGKATGISIYNQIAKEKVPFIVSDKNYISWYACGPTVYDSAHIGHACSYIRLDIIRRILEKYINKNIIQVMCVTNIDDKIIRRSHETNTHWKLLAETYEKEFFAELAVLNVKKPSFVVRSTEYIPQVVQFIEQLKKKNIAYETPDGSVYFSIDNYGRHGKFKSMTQAATITNQDEIILKHKKNPADFVLWKNSKPGEPYWLSPWGLGRPGWHISCSVMASEFFKDVVDIHSGGSDLIFPHHENEESQCCAFHDVKQWVDYWLHTGFLSVKDEKMSKSLGNTISNKEFLASNSPNFLRMLCLATHYRSNIDFNGEEVTYCRTLCFNFYQFFDDCRAYIYGYSDRGNIEATQLTEILEETKKVIEICLKNDFDTGLCVKLLSELMSSTLAMVHAEPGKRCVITVCSVCSYVESFLDFFGFDFSNKSISDNEIKLIGSNLEDIIGTSIAFRDGIRNVALSMKHSDDENMKKVRANLLNLCDDFRSGCSYHGISIKDRKNDLSTWSLVSMKEKINDSSSGANGDGRRENIDSIPEFVFQ